MRGGPTIRGSNRGRKLHGRIGPGGKGVSNGLHVTTESGTGVDDHTSHSTSRMKPPPTSSRKIVLSNKKDASSLENINVKSLDEIKRDKAMREKSGTSTASGGVPAAKYSASTGQKANQESSTVKNMRFSIKPLTVQLKSLPSKALGVSKTFSSVSNNKESATTRSTLPQGPLFNTALDGWSEPDCESLADEEELIWEDSLDVDDGELQDSDELLNEEELEVEKEKEYVDYSDVPLGSSYNEDDFMEMISLHPDDSLFDDELDNKELGPARSVIPKENDCDLRELLKSGQNEKGEKSNHDAKENRARKEDSRSDCSRQTRVAQKDKRKKKHVVSPSAVKRRMARQHGKSRKGSFSKAVPGTQMKGGQRGRGHLRMARDLPPDIGCGFFGLPSGPPLSGLAVPPPGFVMNGISQLNQGPFETAPHKHEFIVPEPPLHYQGQSWRGAPRGRLGRMMRSRGGTVGPQGLLYEGRKVDSRWAGHSPTRGMEWEGTTSTGSTSARNRESDEKPKEVEAGAVVNHERAMFTGHVSRDVTAGVITPKLNAGIRPGNSPVRHSPVPGQEQQGTDACVSGQPAKTSPYHGHESEQPRPGNKRKSPAHNEYNVGRKVQVEARPTGEPNVVFTQPLRHCWQQLNTGQCRRVVCNFNHLSPQELQEYRQTGRIKEPENLQKNQNVGEAQLDCKVQQNQDPLARQMSGYPREKTLQEMEKTVVAHLDNKELGAAWQTIERMSRLHYRPEVHILERLLLLCSDAASNPDIAGQVGCKVFDTIGKVQGKYNRHNYTTLIKCLCHSGQYIRAYEMLGVMKSSNCMPTHEVFLDLVQASHVDPHWAFGLLDEVKRSGLFKTSICSRLLILGCQSGPDCLDKTWSLFEEMVQCQVQPSVEALNNLVKFMSDLKCWEKLVFVLRSCPAEDLVPPDMLTSIMNHACHHTQQAENVLKLLMKISDKKDPGVDHKVWNAFLVACSSTTYASSTAQALVSLMERLKVPLSPQSYDAFMKILVAGNFLAPAMELFLKMTIDAGVLGEPRSVAPGLVLLSEALQVTGERLDMLKVVHFMLDKKIQPTEKVMLPAVVALDQAKNYQGIQTFFKQCQAAAFTPSFDVCRRIVTSLEKWKENPLASLEPYAALRQAYPVLPRSAGDVATAVETPESAAPKRSVCRYFNTPGGCRRGSNCTFLHPQTIAGIERPTGVHPRVGNSESSNPFVLRKPSEFPAAARATVDVQPRTSPSSSTSSAHSLHVRQGPGPLEQFGPAKPITAGVSYDNASIPANRSSNEVLRPPHPAGLVPPAAVITSGGNPDLPPVAPTKTSPFQLRSPLLPRGHHPRSVDSISPGRVSSTNQSAARNPFSVVHRCEERPGIWRTKSYDSYASVAAVEAGGQTRSAPASCTDLGQFYFPSKERIEFYLPRIKFAGQERNWVELAKIYSDIKGAGVDISDGLFEPLVGAFSSNQSDNISDGFDVFLKELRLCLKNVPRGEQAQSVSETELDADDELLVGRIGVALMNLCFRTQRYCEGYNVLFSLHECGVNYSKCGGTVGLQGETMSKASIVLLAVEICLGYDPMQCGSALEVLRGSDFGLPNGNESLTSDEATRRRTMFQKLHEAFLDEGKFDCAYELLQKIGSADNFGVGPQKDMYNAFVRKLLQEGKLEKASLALEQMEANFISRDPETIRALVKGLASSGNIIHAKREFLAGCVSGVYPASFSESNPWSVTIPTSFVRLEVQFYLESYLSRLQERLEGTMALYEDEKLKRLRIFVASDEAPRLYSGHMANEDKIQSTRSMVVSVLENQFNPPLSCIPTEQQAEILVSPSSLNRWFLANPATRRHKKGAQAMNAMITRQTAVAYPYLQPGMTNPDELQRACGSTGITVSLISQSNGKSGRIVRQGSDERPAGLGGWHDLDRASQKALREKVAHAVRGHLTLCMRQGRIQNKDFKETARRLTQQFMEEHSTICQETYDEIKDKVRAFVNTFV